MTIETVPRLNGFAVTSKYVQNGKEAILWVGKRGNPDHRLY